METISTSSGATQPDSPTASTSDAAPLAGRPDHLTAQKVEVGIILQAMLGTQAAMDYMDNNAINRLVAARVLNQPEQRRGRHDQHGVRV
jgi:hypothetical protein